MTIEELTKALESISVEQLTQSLKKTDEVIGERLATIESKLSAMENREPNPEPEKEVDYFTEYLKDSGLIKGGE